MPNSYRAIQVLSVALANQIAAGEVIERPASCLKELLENSLDAGATEVYIDIEVGGLRQIIITDNGLGIDKKDLILAISPHATSKIQVQQDLFCLTTLGFRGEALASIQAVSKVEIISKRLDSDNKAYKLIAYEADTPITETHFVGEHGTTVKLKDLFYNVPARKKFLKSAKTEYLHIESLVTALALSRPEVAIDFCHNQKQIYYLPKAMTLGQRQARVAKLLGKSFIDHAVEINIERVGLKLTGFLGLPETFARTNHQQYFYINGRLIKDRLITHAIKSFFQEKQLLGSGLYPAYVLYFTINPEEVDVNVHPTKHEVRFHEPRLIHDFITSGLASAITQTGLIATSKIETEHEVAMSVQSAQIHHSEAKPPLALLKQPTEPTSSPAQREPTVSNSVVKIGQYLILGETIEQPGVGLVIDLVQGQVELLSYLLTQEQYHWFTAKPLLVPLTIPSSFTEQWVWPERQHYFAHHFGLIYQFKKKNELLVTHLPQILKYMTHQERIASLSSLFQLALHNGMSEWQQAMTQFFPEQFLSRLAVEEWGAQTNNFRAIQTGAFINKIDEMRIKIIGNN